MHPSWLNQGKPHWKCVWVEYDLSINRFPFILFMKCNSRAELRYSPLSTFWMMWNPREQCLANVCFLITKGYKDIFRTATRECVFTLFNTTVLRLYMHHFWWPQHSFPHTHVHAGRLSHTCIYRVSGPRGLFSLWLNTHLLPSECLFSQNIFAQLKTPA